MNSFSKTLKNNLLASITLGLCALLSVELSFIFNSILLTLLSSASLIAACVLLPSTYAIGSILLFLLAMFIDGPDHFFVFRIALFASILLPLLNSRYYIYAISGIFLSWYLTLSLGLSATKILLQIFIYQENFQLQFTKNLWLQYGIPGRSLIMPPLESLFLLFFIFLTTSEWFKKTYGKNYPSLQNQALIGTIATLLIYCTFLSGFFISSQLLEKDFLKLTTAVAMNQKTLLIIFLFPLSMPILFQTISFLGKRNKNLPREYAVLTSKDIPDNKISSPNQLNEDPHPH